MYFVVIICANKRFSLVYITPRKLGGGFTTPVVFQSIFHGWISGGFQPDAVRCETFFNAIKRNLQIIMTRT